MRETARRLEGRRKEREVGVFRPYLLHVLVFPENWVHLLVGVEPIDTTKPKMGRRKDLLLATSKENTGDLSQSSVCPNSKNGKVLS